MLAHKWRTFYIIQRMPHEQLHARPKMKQIKLAWQPWRSLISLSPQMQTTMNNTTNSNPTSPLKNGNTTNQQKEIMEFIEACNLLNSSDAQKRSHGEKYLLEIKKRPSPYSFCFAILEVSSESHLYRYIRLILCFIHSSCCDTVSLEES